MMDSRRQVLTAKELMADPMFAGVPPKFLLWQQGLAVRRQLKTGELLCKQGDPGNTAYLIRSGSLKITGWKPATKEGSALFGRLFGGTKPREELFSVTRTPADKIVGDLACLSGSARTADIAAVEDSEVWEIRRNLLDRMMRSPSQRATFERIYRQNALRDALQQSDLFGDRPGSPFPAEEFAECLEFLRGERRPGVPRLSFVQVSPGQTVFEQGNWADDFYLVRLGHIRVVLKQDGREGSVLWRGPGTILGEIGLLALSPEDAGRPTADVDRDVAAALQDTPDDALTASLPAGRRTASCSALDHVELARIRRQDFLVLLKRFPTVRRRLVETSLGRLKSDARITAEAGITRQYVEQGLYQAQNLLALDLTKCTHCDECTKACVQKHGTESHGVPVTRLLRDGIRLGQFLVATSCRSCKDAYCMAGCPVDAIHRGKHQQIVIEDHCIGCGLCSSNCPYGNIWMVPNEKRQLEVPDAENPGKTTLVAQAKAATCDLCDAEGERDTPLPRCVHACPHDAAHRMTGETLLNLVRHTAST